MDYKLLKALPNGSETIIQESTDPICRVTKIVTVKDNYYVTKDSFVFKVENEEEAKDLYNFLLSDTNILY